MGTDGGISSGDGSGGGVPQQGSPDLRVPDAHAAVDHPQGAGSLPAVWMGPAPVGGWGVAVPALGVARWGKV